MELPDLPEGFGWVDPLDGCGGLYCPHGEYFEVDSEETADGCKNPLFDMGVW